MITGVTLPQHLSTGVAGAIEKLRMNHRDVRQPVFLPTLRVDSYPTSESPFDSSGHVIAQFLRSLQCSPDNLHLACRDLASRFAMTSCASRLRSWPASMRQKIGTALLFGCACAQPRQINPFGQCSLVGKAHRCVPISRRLQLAAKAAHSVAVGFFNPSSSY